MYICILVLLEPWRGSQTCLILLFYIFFMYTWYIYIYDIWYLTHTLVQAKAVDLALPRKPSDWIVLESPICNCESYFSYLTKRNLHRTCIYICLSSCSARVPQSYLWSAKGGHSDGPRCRGVRFETRCCGTVAALVLEDMVGALSYRCSHSLPLVSQAYTGEIWDARSHAHRSESTEEGS